MLHLRFRGHDVAVLFSERSRAAYAREAVDSGATYSFIGAAGAPLTWLKGELAYLAPNGADLLLSRCNLKHDVVEEGDLSAAMLNRCRALLIPNAAHLADRTIALVEAWHARPGSCLVVSGKTNLPPRLLGLQSCTERHMSGYTGW